MCFRFLITLIALFLATAPASPQSPVMTVNVDLVNVYFTVANRSGRLITKLDAGHFAVYEDGQIQTVTHFSRETAPVAMVLLLDTSGSVRDKLGFEQSAATQFLRATLRPDVDSAAVITFDSDFELRQDFTQSQALLSAAVGRIVAGGGTRLYDALCFAMEQSLRGRSGRKVIVLLTDGDDQSSRHSPEDVIELARRYDVAIYSISVNRLGMIPHDNLHSDAVLEMLGSESGGRAFFPKQLSGLTGDFARICDELRAQYTLGYRSTNQKRDGTFRRIRIEAAGKYATRARSGYYAPAPVTADARVQH
jgi:Ca-activated chloride channel family protein